MMDAKKVDVTEMDVLRITEKAMQLMSSRANAMTPYDTFSASDIASCVAADPSGDTARYLAQLVAWGIEWLIHFREIPDLLDVWGVRNA